MSKLIQMTAVVFVALLSGCVSSPPVYYQRSPMIETVKDSNFKTNSRVEQNPVRYDPYTVVGTAVQQQGEVVIRISFNYTPPRRHGQGRTNNCLLLIKGSDNSLFERIDCKAEQSGNTFIISFRTDKKGIKSFDLRSLPGRYEGAWPILYSNSYVTLRYSPGVTTNLGFVYVGKDPFGL